MPYGVFETTRQGAAPVELYKFFWGDTGGGASGGGGTSAGTGGDTTVLGECGDKSGTLIHSETWSYVDSPGFLGSWIPTVHCVSGGRTGGFGATGPTITTTFSCGIGAGGGHAFYTKTVSLSSYIGRDILVSCPVTRNIANGFFTNGIRVNGVFGDIAGESLDMCQAVTLQVPGSGNLTLEVGQYDLEFAVNPLTYITTYGPITVRIIGGSSTPPAGGGGGALGTPLLVLNYTTADVPITYNSEVYNPFIGHRTPFLSGTGERTASEIDLSLPMDHPVAMLALDGVPRGPIGCTIYRLDRSDLTQAAIPLQGQVTRHRIEGRWCVLTLGNVGTLLNRKLPRMLTQRHCPHVLYGPFCQKNQSLFTHTGLVVLGVSGRQVTVTGAAAIKPTDLTYFQEGVLKTDDGRKEFIERQDGDTLTLKEALPGLEMEDVVTLIAGCDHKASTCDTRFANIAHFGGEIGMPDRNPFTGGGLIGPDTTVEVIN